VWSNVGGLVGLLDACRRLAIVDARVSDVSTPGDACALLVALSRLPELRSLRLEACSQGSGEVVRSGGAYSRQSTSILEEAWKPFCLA